MPHTKNLSSEMQHCIQECLACHAICLETVQHCLGLGGKHAKPKHIGMLLSCAEICHTSATFMLQSSDFHEQTCGLCAEVCHACAKECEQMAAGDHTMIQCADACRRCARSCEKMAHAMA